jgi:hypothetical protein
VALHTLEDLREELDELEEFRLADPGFIVQPPEGFYMDAAEAYPGLVMKGSDRNVEERRGCGEAKTGFWRGE